MSFKSISRSKKVLLACATALVIGALFLQSSLAKNWVENQLVSTLSERLGAEVRLDRFDYQLYRARGELGGLNLLSDGWNVDIGRITVSASTRGLSMEIFDAELSFDTSTQGAPSSDTNEVRLDGLPWALDSLNLHQARVELSDSESGARWELPSVDVSLAAHIDGHRGRLVADRSTLHAPHVLGEPEPLAIGRTSVEFDWQENRLSFTQIESVAEASSMTATAEVSRIRPLRGEFGLEASLDGNDLGEWIPESIASDVTGTYQLNVQTKLDGELEAQGRVKSSDLSSEAFGAITFEADFAASTDQIWIERLDASLLGGSAQGSMILFLDETGAYAEELTLQLKDLDLTSLRPAQNRSVIIPSQLSGAIRGRLDGLERAGAQLDGTVTLNPIPGIRPAEPGAPLPVPLSGSMSLSVRDGALSVESQSLTTPGGLAHLEVRLTPEDGLSGAIQLDQRRLAPLVENWWPSLRSRGELDGSIHIGGALGGTLENPNAHLQLTAEIWPTEPMLEASEPPEAPDAPKAGRASEDATWHLNADLDASAASIAIRSARLSGQGLTASAMGKLGIRERDLSMTGQLEALQVPELPSVWVRAATRLAGLAQQDAAENIEAFVQEMHGTWEGPFFVNGTLDAPRLRSELRVSEGRWLKTPFHGDALWRVDPDGLQVETLTLQWGEGSLETSFDIDFGASTSRGTMTGRDLLIAPSLDYVASRHGAHLPPIARQLVALEANWSGPWTNPVGSVDAQIQPDTEALPNWGVSMRSDGSRVTSEIRSRGIAQGGPLWAHVVTDLVDGYPSHLQSQLENLPLSALVNELVAGTLEANIDARGELAVDFRVDRPEAVRYRLEVDRVLAQIFGVVGGTSSPFLVTGDRNELRITSLDLIGEGTAIEVSGTLPLSERGRLALNTKGQLRLEWLQPAASITGIEALEGAASVDLQFSGTRQTPTARGELSLSEVGGRWSEVQVDDLSAMVRGDGDRLHLETLRGNTHGGDFVAEGSFPLIGIGTDRPARITFQTTPLDLTEHLLTEYHEDTKILLSVNGSVRADGLSVEQLHGSGEIVQLTAGLGRLDLDNDDPAPWTLSGGAFELPNLTLGNRFGGQSNLKISAESRLPTKHRPLTYRASLEGILDTAMLDPVLSSDGSISMAGPLRLDLVVASSETNEKGPQLSGSGRIEDGEFVLRELGLVLSDLEGELRFSEQGLVLDALRASAGGGNVTASGTVNLVGARVANAELRATAENVRLNYPEGLRSEIGGDLRFAGEDHRYQIDGEVTMSRGLFTQDFNLASELLSSVQTTTARFTDTDGLEHRTTLNVRARTAEDIRVDNNVATVQAGANFLLGGTLAAPELSGFMTARRGGTLLLSSRRYELEAARVQLDGYPLAPASLDVTARTTVDETDIQVTIRGPLDNLSTELRSLNDPSLTQGDLASLLVTGRRLEENTGDTRGVLGGSMANYFGTAIGQLASSTLGQALPFDQFSVRPVLIREQTTEPGARLTLGKDITDKLSITYSLLLNNADDQLWFVDYRLPKRLKFQAVRTPENDYVGGLTQTVSFDFDARNSPQRPRPSTLRVSSATLQLDTSSSNQDTLERSLGERLNLNPGDRFDFWKASRIALSMKEHLIERGYWGAVTDFDSEIQDGRATVEFRVETGPRIEPLQDTGSATLDDTDDTYWETIRDAWDGRLPLPLRVQSGEHALRRRLFLDGYYQAELSLTASEPSETIHLRLALSRGPRGQRVEIRYPGRVSIPRRELDGALPGAGSPDFYDWITQKTPRLKQALRLVYANAGHLDAEVGELSIAFHEESGTLEIAVPILEGLRTTTGTIAFVGIDDEARRELLEEVPIREGEPLNLEGFIRSHAILSRYYRRRGYQDVEVTASLEAGAELDQLSPVFRIATGNPTRVGQIRIEGNHDTDPSLINRQLTFSSGDPLQMSELAESQRRLYELGVFRFADIRADEGSTDDADDLSTPSVSTTPGPTRSPPIPIVQDVVVDVTETSDLEFDYGFFYSDKKEYAVLLDARTPNLFGEAYQLGLTARLNQDRRLYRTTFFTPFLGRYAIDTTAFVTRVIDEDELFTTRSWSLTFQQRRRLRRTLHLQWSYVFGRSVSEELDPLSPFSDPLSVNRSRVIVSLIGDRRNNLISPTEGRFWNISFEIAPPELRSDLNFAKIFGQFFRYRSLREGWVWASSYRLGLAKTYANSSVLIDEDRFQAGGANSIRGFARNSLGPPDPLFEDSGGKAVIIMNQELRFPLYRWFRAAAFYDTGNVYENVSDLRLSKLRHTAGLGLRVNLPFGVLRLDWAHVLDFKPGDQRSRFVFSLGHAF